MMGAADPPARTRQMTVGDLSMLADGADLRYIRWQGVELVRRVYVTVRDEDWNTPATHFRALNHRVAKSRCDVDGEVSSASTHVPLDWSIHASTSSPRHVSYQAEFRPRSEFLYSRIGLCMLFPPGALVGATYIATVGGRATRGRFEKLIAPQYVRGDEILPLFPAFDRLQITIAGVGALEISSTGDLLEMEDQRNWGDGSFKAYCTPLSVPRPHLARPENPFQHRIEMAMVSGHARRIRRPSSETVVINVGGPAGVLMPSIGVELYEPRLSSGVSRSMRSGHFEHLRVDLRREPVHQLREAAKVAQDTGIALAPACYLTGETDDAARVAKFLSELDPPPVRIFAFPRNKNADDGTLARLLRQTLGQRLRTVPIIGGTDIWFVDLNRCRPKIDLLDGVSWAVTPQVHLGDSLTLVEGLEAQRDQVATAMHFAPGRPLLVGPITLRPRYNPNARDSREQALNRPPTSVDRRQSTLEAAAWTVGSLASITAQQLTAATYFEVAGERGIVGDDGSPYPVWHVLSSAAACAGMQAILTTVDQPLRAAAVVIEAREESRLGLIANLTASPLRVHMTGTTPSSLQVQPLDPSTGWHDGQSIPRSDVVELDLDAHGVARLVSA
jgi:D-apionolactonase